MNSIRQSTKGIMKLGSVERFEVMHMDDACYTCTGYGDDYRYDAETDEWISNCPECPYNPGRKYIEI